MARAPTIAGRPAPQRKHRSSGGSSTNTAGPSSTLKGPSAAGSAPRTLVTKAYKRAQKRAHLLVKTSESSMDEHAKACALLVGPSGTISKSALRRRKRKARDDLAHDDVQGRKGGVGELQSAVAELEDDLASDDDDAEEDTGYAVTTNAGKVSAAQRKRVLALEQTRQQAILGDPSFRASPFAALREHARNSMAQQQAGQGARR